MPKTYAGYGKTRLAPVSCTKEHSANQQHGSCLSNRMCVTDVGTLSYGDPDLAGVCVVALFHHLGIANRYFPVPLFHGTSCGNRLRSEFDRATGLWRILGA